MAREAKPTAAAKAGALVAIQLNYFVAPILATTTVLRVHRRVPRETVVGVGALLADGELNFIPL